MIRLPLDLMRYRGCRLLFDGSEITHGPSAVLLLKLGLLERDVIHLPTDALDHAVGPPAASASSRK